MAHVGAGLPADSTAYGYVRYADYISANGLLVDRHAWDAVGGFDERYFPAYYEDVDLCLALLDHGYRVAYEPRARLQHLESQSTSTILPQLSPGPEPRPVGGQVVDRASELWRSS